MNTSTNIALLTMVSICYRIQTSMFWVEFIAWFTQHKIIIKEKAENKYEHQYIYSIRVIEINRAKHLDQTNAFPQDKINASS
mgnify:CR=1 FL=1